MEFSEGEQKSYTYRRVVGKTNKQKKKKKKKEKKTHPNLSE